MLKKFLKISSIILLNLFAFLLFGSILGAIFWREWLFLVWSVIISIIPLTVILFMEIKKITEEFNNIKEEKNDWNSK